MADDKNKGFVRGIVIGPCVCAFLHTENPNTGGKYPSQKYEGTFLFPKTEAALVKLLGDAALKAGQEKWGPQIKLSDLKVGLKNGDEKANLQGFAGHWYINPRSNKKPLIVGPDRKPLPAGVKLMASDTCRVCVTAGTFPANLDKELADALSAAGKQVMISTDNDGKITYFRPAVTFYLDAIQRLAAGPGFGGAADPSVFPEESPATFPASGGPGAGEDPFG